MPNQEFHRRNKCRNRRNGDGTFSELIQGLRIQFINFVQIRWSSGKFAIGENLQIINARLSDWFMKLKSI